MMLRRRKERGALLGVVLVLMLVLVAASLFAFWGLRGETSSAGSDRLSRQLFDCAEQGLAAAKLYFTANSVGYNTWPNYYNANICSSSSPTKLTPSCAPNGPLPTVGTGSAPPGYPDSVPFTNTINVTTANASTTIPLTYTFGIYNVPNSGESATQEVDKRAIIYCRCSDGVRSRSVQALIQAQDTFDPDYKFTAGNGMRNQNNFNN
jgi:hypothetical protein